jgi:hypothetical protein
MRVVVQVTPLRTKPAYRGLLQHFCQFVGLLETLYKFTNYSFLIYGVPNCWTIRCQLQLGDTAVQMSAI